MTQYDFTGVAQWRKVEGYFDLEEAIAIQTTVKTLPPNSNLVELGSFRGKSAIAIASVLPPDSFLYCVDSFENTILKRGEQKPPLEQVIKTNLDAFASNVGRFGVTQKLRVMVMKTDEAATKFPPNFFDLILIDADHHYEPVKADLANWYPKLKPSGYLFCDDYDLPKFPGVKQAIDETKLPGKVVAPSLWFHQKPLA